MTDFLATIFWSVSLEWIGWAIVGVCLALPFVLYRSLGSD